MVAISQSTRKEKRTEHLTCQRSKRRYQRLPWVVGRRLLLGVHLQVLPSVYFVRACQGRPCEKKRGAPRVKQVDECVRSATNNSYHS